MYIYTYVYIYICTYIHTYIYMLMYTLLFIGFAGEANVFRCNILFAQGDGPWFVTPYAAN